ncbi:MAG TPA: hypothetical protein VH592_10870 [Gemmataceae bacterium]
MLEERYAQLEKIVSASALLGYLNFSDGRSDPRWQKQFNDAYAFLAEHGETAPWQAIFAWLSARLGELHAQGSAAFRDVTQAEDVLEMADNVLTAYQRHHADLLAHLDDRDVFGPYFLTRVFEAVLVQRAAGMDNGEKAVAAVLVRLNDFVGHRPIAILETRPQGEPYDHERHRPLPLYIKGAGVAYGPYHDLIARALDILKSTDAGLRAEAQFDFELLDELAVDLRAYDHGHPVNRRPNYVFGEWDPHHLDNQGRFRRYVVRKITLDALMDRINAPGPSAREELLLEGAAVLAGTLLMATGISGYGPAAHDSAATLATLLPRIARYRDVFYEHLLKRLEGAHGDRLREELATTRQAFGGARQHLNAYLARHRAMQLQQRYLALVFAQMGHPEASRDEARRIPAVSVRLLSEILSQMTSGQVEAEQGQLREAAERLPEIENLLHRGIACGAFVDPWNILGFQGLFPLSPAREDSIRDPRVDELIQVVEQIFNLYARLMSEAAAAGDSDLVRTLITGLRRLAEWWDRFATIEVGDVRRLHGREAASSASGVANALARWHKSGEASADLAFWRQQLEHFRSPKAFSLVVDTLLRKADYRSALGLLCSWISQAEQVPLEDNVWSFHALSLRWMLAVAKLSASGGRKPPVSSQQGAYAPRSLEEASQRRDLIVKFFDFLEANAEDYWQVPELELPGPPLVEEKEDDLFGAAYEDVTYRDTTDDNEGAVSDGGPVEEFDLEPEGDRLDKRLHFLSTLARLWQIAARTVTEDTRAGASWEQTPSDWLRTARGNRQRMLVLIDTIHTHPLREPTGDYDSLVEYDRRRVLKEQLLFTAIGACLDMSLAVSALQGAVDAGFAQVRSEEQGSEENEGSSPHSSLLTPHLGEEAADSFEPFAIRLEKALFTGETAAAREVLPAFIEKFQNEPLLFAPLAEGGTPRAILRVRIAQTVLRALLANLPRLGLLRETYNILRTARAMEQAQPMRGRGVTEFNHFFQAAYQAVVESVVESASSWGSSHNSDEELVAVLERLTGPFLTLWMEHSRSLQLSVLETLTGESEWRAVQAFVQRYGADLFHARFMTMANLRGILHRGVGAYLDYLRDNPDPLRPIRLLDELDQGIRREDAKRRLEIVLQAVIENYEEYKDYNTTTTQSDYGENLHVLLEFLRLKVAYERHAWQFRPLVLAHEVLARHGRTQTAILWEQSLTRVTRDLARRHLEQLDSLERVRGIRLNTIRDHLNERFIKPLALDRLCALIEPSMRESRQQGEKPSFTRLRHELQAFTATPMGVGLDVPYWLRRLEMEVHRVQATRTTIAVLAENFFRVPRRPLSWEEVQRQLGDWDRPSLPP